MTEKRIKPKYLCKKCIRKFYTEYEAEMHLIRTGHYSPKDHITYLHAMEKIEDEKGVSSRNG